MEADKIQAVADAKLLTIEQSLPEELTGELGPDQLEYEDVASRTQSVTLGWTVSGQMCLHRVGGAVHVSARRTAIEPPPDMFAPLVSEHSKARALTILESTPKSQLQRAKIISKFTKSSN